MKIAFSGASGTGKTTLATWMAAEFGLPFNPVGARSVAAEMGFASPYDVDALGQRGEFQRRVLEAKLEWESKHDSFVTDRTPFDVVGYTALHHVAGVTTKTLSSAVEGAEAYSRIILCPIELFWCHDGDPARVHERAYHVVFEALVFGLLRGLTTVTHHCRLETWSLRARQHELRSLLRTER